MGAEKACRVSPGCRMAAPLAESGSRFEVRWTGNVGAAQGSGVPVCSGREGLDGRNTGARHTAGRVPEAVSGGRAGRTASVHTSGLILLEVGEAGGGVQRRTRRPAAQRCVWAAVCRCVVEGSGPCPCPRGAGRQGAAPEVRRVDYF